MRITTTLLIIWAVTAAVSGSPSVAEESIKPPECSKLPANRWVLIHREDNSGGKAFAKAVYAENVGRIYLWGTGGKKPARNVYLRYELEAFDPDKPNWSSAFPASKQNEWTAESRERWEKKVGIQETRLSGKQR